MDQQVYYQRDYWTVSFIDFLLIMSVSVGFSLLLPTVIIFFQVKDFIMCST